LERRFSKQNSVIRLNSNILTRPKCFAPHNFWAGYDTAARGSLVLKYSVIVS